MKVATASERIAVDRAWIGAPRTALANPTVALFVGALALFATGTCGYLIFAFPIWITVLLHTVAIYLMFTVLHEGMHGIAHPSRAVNDLLARLAGIPLTITLPLFRGVHYEHHSHTNDPERDPDLIVSWRPRLALPLWSLGIMIEYRLAFYGRRLWRNATDHREALAMDLALLMVTVAAIAGGWWRALVVLWFGPAALAVMFLGFAFDFLPHYPFDSADRYFDTRVCPGRTLNVVFLGQNYHLIHHLWTTIPWYRYRAVFAQIRGDLEARGCRIGWRAPPGAGRHVA
jgi:beta-carotene hydroxylase